MGRAPCCDKANVKKGPWSPEEDAKLKAYIEQNGTGGNWIALPQKIGLKRCGKSCRLRWLNYLRPNIKHGGFTEEEENIICSLYLSIGSRWSIIAAQLPGRTDNDIKNYWNTRLKKKLMAKQRKEQAACRASLLEQEYLKRESDCFLGNPALDQVPYWEGQQLVMPIMHLNPDDAYPGNQDHQFSRLLTKIGGHLHDDSHQLISSTSMDHYQYAMQDSFYVDSPHALASSSASMNSTNTNSTEWPPTDQCDVNGFGLNNIHQRQANQADIPAELVQLDMYLSNLLSFEGTESCYSGAIDVGKSSTTSTSGGSTASWADMSSLVNTPESNFDIYQKGVPQKVVQ